MADKERKPFNRRAFVSLTALLAGISLPLSGLADHLLRKQPDTAAGHNWMAVHGLLGILFTAFAVWHAALNRRVLLHHAQGRPGSIPALSREAVLAAALVALVLFFAVGHAWLMR